jgi:hypothetical protein
MQGIDFTKALKALPPYCRALMQNVFAGGSAGIAPGAEGFGRRTR